MHKILVIRLYFLLLGVLHVSDYISPSSGATLLAVHRIWYMPVYAETPVCCVAIATQQTGVSAFTKCDAQLTKVAPEDGIIQSETCRASNGK